MGVVVRFTDCEVWWRVSLTHYDNENHIVSDDFPSEWYVFCMLSVRERLKTKDFSPHTFNSQMPPHTKLKIPFEPFYWKLQVVRLIVLCSVWKHPSTSVNEKYIFSPILLRRFNNFKKKIYQFNLTIEILFKVIVSFFSGWSIDDLKSKSNESLLEQ